MESTTVAPEAERSFFTPEEALPEGTSVSDALKAADLAYTVEQRPVFDERGGEVEGWVRNVRKDTDETLGIVSPRYQVIQNADGFEVVELMFNEVGGQPVAGGNISSGRDAWLLFEMDEKVEIAGDPIAPYVLFSNTHDGSRGLYAANTPVRVFCTNALQYALQAANLRFRIRHTGDINAKLAAALGVVKNHTSYMGQFKDVADKLALRKVKPDTLNKWLERLYPTDSLGDRAAENMEEARATVRYLVKEAPNLEGHHMTAWAFVNAVAEQADWGSNRERSQRMGRLIWTSPDSRLKDKALKIATASLN